MVILTNNNIWGSQKTSKKGIDLKKVIDNNNLRFRNDKGLIYFNTSTSPPIDITLYDPPSWMDYEWEANIDLRDCKTLDLRLIADTEWGADYQLFKLCKYLILLKIDYACFVN